MWLMKILYTYMGSCAYCGYIVSDIDTTMMSYLTHPKKRSRGKVNISGHSPEQISVPTRFATHYTRYVPSAFFELTKTTQSIQKLDVL